MNQQRGRRYKSAFLNLTLDFSAENAEIADCLVEKSGFEPSRPFTLSFGKLRRDFCACSALKPAVHSLLARSPRI